MRFDLASPSILLFACELDNTLGNTIERSNEGTDTETDSDGIPGRVGLCWSFPSFSLVWLICWLDEEGSLAAHVSRDSLWHHKEQISAVGPGIGLRSLVFEVIDLYSASLQQQQEFWIVCPSGGMEGIPQSKLSSDDSKYEKRRRSQYFRRKIRYCFLFSVLALVGCLRVFQRDIFRYLYNHRLQSYANAPYLRTEYAKWLQEYRNSPLIPRMLPGQTVAFRVLDSYNETKVFLQKATPPYFVLYYANWCGHSANAIPVIQEFAKSTLQPNHLELVAIEESNPFSGRVPGFPTLYIVLKPKRTGGQVIRKEFTSKMNVPNLIKFYKQNVDRTAG